MTESRLDAELRELVRIARLGAERVRALYDTDFAVDHKGPDDPVTEADRQANELICDALARSFPGDAIIAEESAPDEAGLASLVRARRGFYVDPVDGTKEFVARNGEFCTMLGLAEEGRASAGVVVLPLSGTALVGRVGQGAFRVELDGREEPLVVDDAVPLGQAVLMVSRSHRSPRVERLAARLGVGKMVPCGSVGLKVARLATREAHVYVHLGGGSKKWDACAPEAIVRAAGARFSTTRGAPLDYAEADLPLRDGLIASTGALYDRVLAETRALLAEPVEGAS
jgi:3'(2'), 5'-bisphosphate nucleotidase